MSKLKNISLFDKIIVLLFIILIISVFFVEKSSKFTGKESKVCGHITDLNYNNEKLTIEIKSKEKILGNYYTDKNIYIYKLGDEVCLYGKLTKPSKNTVFNQFNYRNYLLSKNIFYIIKIDKIEKIKDNTKIIYSIKNIIKNRINKVNNSSSYLYAFILGDNRMIDENMTNKFQKIGISHLFSVSGMHIGFISYFIMLILNVIIKNKKKKMVLLSIFLVVVCSIFNTSASIIRTLSLFLCLTIDKLFNLNMEKWKYIVFIFFIVLIYNKYTIYNIGFWFSYSISFALILYQDNLTNQKNKALIISLISFLISLPILINNFFVVNFLTPFFNLILIPFVTVLLFPLSFVCFLFPIFDGIYSFLLEIFESIVTFFSTINCFCFSLQKIPIIIIVFYYLLIIVIINNLFKRKYKYFIVLIIIIVIHHNINFLKFNSSLYVIDVGQGDSVLLKIKNKNILLDTGGLTNNYSDYNITKKNLIPLFYSFGINKIDWLILSHGDYDHMGEAINLVENFKVEKVIFNCGEFNELEQDLIKVLDKKKIPYYSCIKELNIDNNKLYFLNNKDYGNENDNSSVIFTELNNHKFLFMGDAGVDVEEDLIKKYNLQDIDVLKVGHHGSKTSSGKKFIDEINPKCSIISVGKNNRYGHPNKEVLNNLENSKIYRTDEDGSIMFMIKNNKLKIETCSP